jgi:predicted Zn-dependent protease
MASRIAGMNPVVMALAVALTSATADLPPSFQQALDAKARGDLEEAERELMEVCQASPGWALPWIELSEVQLSRGASEKALSSVAQAAVLDAANPRVYHDRALIERASGHAELAERDEAFAVSLRPEYAEAVADLAELRWAAGKRQEAVALLEGLSTAHPEELSYTVRLVDAYSELGQDVAAERELRLLISRDPHSPVWHRRLARLLAAQGLSKEAAHEIELADGLSHPASPPRHLRRLPKSKH